MVYSDSLLKLIADSYEHSMGIDLPMIRGHYARVKAGLYSNIELFRAELIAVRDSFDLIDLGTLVDGSFYPVKELSPYNLKEGDKDYGVIFDARESILGLIQGLINKIDKRGFRDKYV